MEFVIWKNAHEGSVKMTDIDSDWLQWALDNEHASLASNHRAKEAAELFIEYRKLKLAELTALHQRWKGVIDTLDYEIKHNPVKWDGLMLKQKALLRNSYMVRYHVTFALMPSH